jgi:hypothetical protein
MATTWDNGLTTWDGGLTTWDDGVAPVAPVTNSGGWPAHAFRRKAKPQEVEAITEEIAKQDEPDESLAERLADLYGAIDSEATQLSITAQLVARHNWQLQEAKRYIQALAQLQDQMMLAAITALASKKRQQEEEFFLLCM